MVVPLHRKSLQCLPKLIAQIPVYTVSEPEMMGFSDHVSIFLSYFPIKEVLIPLTLKSSQ